MSSGKKNKQPNSSQKTDLTVLQDNVWHDVISGTWCSHIIINFSFSSLQMKIRQHIHLLPPHPPKKKTCRPYGFWEQDKVRGEVSIWQDCTGRRLIITSCSLSKIIVSLLVCDVWFFIRQEAFPVRDAQTVPLEANIVQM